MQLNTKRIRELLKAFDFRPLFIEELGWDHHNAPIEILLEGRKITLNAIAQKRGMVACHYTVSPGDKIPEYPVRRKIEHQVAKIIHEHLIVFTDAKNSTQIWQWVKREPGKPVACREHTFHKAQPGDALIQKLTAIAFSLDEEETISLTDVTRRARAGFDVERVTKRFYDRFKKEHTTFLKFVTGITDSTDLEWYASVMLNRLMFVYFIQRKGFLDSDPEYLRNRLSRMRREHGKDRFYSFYRYFLLRLFHEGLGGKARTAELENLLGKIPYFDGGFFERHPVEKRWPNIQIPDEAFERIFDYFDQYQWHLDERPLRSDNEINPDVLGYIFEKYINQKQMGAYYTKEDITEYISKNTVIPFLFDAARPKCKVAFENPGGPTIWNLLSSDPDRYIYPAVKHGVIRKDGTVTPETDLPEFVQTGMHDPKARMFDNRYNLQQAPANDLVRLVTETWREYVFRRIRCLEIRGKLLRGDVRDINDLITLNLDIRQFAQDVIENCEGPDLLRAFWHAIEHVTILDPTCGSGAFLFAALNILEPLYEACLDRMAAFVEDLDRSGQKHRPEKFSDFRRLLARVEDHPNRRYFIFKSIILNNLFGVDIMEEAVEICKLRLFLKLVAQVEPDPARDNFGIEPLPDIDFNIRAGNTLVGYATAEEVKKAFQESPAGALVQQKFMFADDQNQYDRFDEQLRIADSAFRQFRDMQTDKGMDAKDFASAKQTLRDRLMVLDDELNRHLAGEYGVKLPSPSGRGTKGEGYAYDKWLKSHQPFHWFVEFYGIMQGGGFDVIIGNPPWKEYSAVKSDYTARNYYVEKTGNVYALCAERSLQLMSPTGYFSFIVQLPLVSSSRMVTLRLHLSQQCGYLNVVPCDDRPGKLFEGLQHCRSCIFVARKRRQSPELAFFTTRYNRWATEARTTLFQILGFSPLLYDRLFQGQFPKMDTLLHVEAFNKVFNHQAHQVHRIQSSGPTNHFIFYQEATQYWVKAIVGLPYYAKNRHEDAPAHGRYLYFQDAETVHIVSAVLNSSLFYSYFISYGDCFHLSDTLATNFPIAAPIFGENSLVRLSERLMEDLKKHATKKKIKTKDGDEISYDEFNVSESKPIIDQIDQLLAKHYGFTDEELDFIINYDIKYRMGRGVDSGEDDG